MRYNVAFAGGFHKAPLTVACSRSHSSAYEDRFAHVYGDWRPVVVGLDLAGRGRAL